MAGELTKTPPPLHVPGTPAHEDHATKPPTHATDETLDPTTTEGGGTVDPTDPGTGTGGGGTGTSTGTGGGGVHVPHTPVTIPPLPTTNVTPVDQVLTLAQATLQCTLDGVNPLLPAFQTCLDNYMHPKTTAGKQAAATAKSRLEKFYTLPTEAPSAS
jgi:hypothetical protein